MSLNRGPLSIPVDLLEIGCSVWALDLNEQTDADARDVKGGTIVEISTGTNYETGEIERLFVTATPWRGALRFDHVLAHEVAQAEPVNTSAMRRLIRVAAQVVADPHKRAGSDTARCIRLQAELMEAL